jgi:hypothetical protein
MPDGSESWQSLDIGQEENALTASGPTHDYLIPTTTSFGLDAHFIYPSDLPRSRAAGTRTGIAAHCAHVITPYFDP